MANNKYYRILSFDGGGIRGLISTVMLERLEQKLKQHNSDKRLIDYFDIIAGTSTGSLIACALATNRFNASEIKSLYIRRGIEIFPRLNYVLASLLSRIRIGFGQPIYDGKGLEKVLKEELGETFTFVDLAKPTIVTSYDTYNRQAVVFKNTKTEFEKIPVWEICRSSAAAPVAFPGHKMMNQGFLQYLKAKGFDIPPEGAIPLIDGGVVANDPALCAIAERLRWNSAPPTNPKWNALVEEKVNLENILVASFGTGHNLNRIGITEAREWGLLQWASPLRGIPLLDVLFDGSSDAVSYIAEEILDSRHFRFQPRLDQDLPAFSANPGNMAAMQQVTETFLNQQEIDNKLNQLVNMLV
ncbi:patatin-like phospholipase family protein [Chroococcidiopsis sp. CCMEE 29]|uniref:patatin-like phospholipase family protein n=1 Tax=Chroococcidiopsis sp. CCMEE 29 TaxID=155894 RepID=UPI00201FCAF7|nr:patatin-like phospholipase family protein [Chroococcidiopsis sp. CCMEE 29]